MRSCLIRFLRSYWPCILASMLLLIGDDILYKLFGERVFVDADMLKWDAVDLYLLYFVPVYSIGYGILTNIFYKKIWLPNFLYLLMIVVFSCIPDVIRSNNFNVEFWMITCIPAFLSIAFSLLTAAFRASFSELKQALRKK